MIKVDLITGFLGAGKTTFIKKYAAYLLRCGEKLAILENDYGAVNVDMMLLQDLQVAGCGLEMVAGGCDQDCHVRRFKTKLIALAMEGYEHVIIEPSGIFDMDEFFDVLAEPPLNRWYEVGNVITIVDAGISTEKNLSAYSRYMLASQLAEAGCILFSHVEKYDIQVRDNTTQLLQSALREFQCSKQIEALIWQQSWETLADADYERLAHCGRRGASYVKSFQMTSYDYQTLYYMHVSLGKEELLEKIKCLFGDASCGHVFRCKGFVPVANGQWLQINAKRENVELSVVEHGQAVLIVIGEALSKEMVDSYFPENICP